MSRFNQVRFNARCLAAALKAGQWAKARFQSRGLLRALGLLADAS